MVILVRVEVVGESGDWTCVGGCWMNGLGEGGVGVGRDDEGWVVVGVEIEVLGAGGGEEEDDDDGSLGSATAADDFLLIFLGAGMGIGAAEVNNGSSLAFPFPLSTFFPLL